MSRALYAKDPASPLPTWLALAVFWAACVSQPAGADVVGYECSSAGTTVSASGASRAAAAGLINLYLDEGRPHLTYSLDGIPMETTRTGEVFQSSRCRVRVCAAQGSSCPAGTDRRQACARLTFNRLSGEFHLTEESNGDRSDWSGRCAMVPCAGGADGHCRVVSLPPMKIGSKEFAPETGMASASEMDRLSSEVEQELAKLREQTRTVARTRNVHKRGEIVNVSGCDHPLFAQHPGHRPPVGMKLVMPAGLPEKPEVPAGTEGTVFVSQVDRDKGECRMKLVLAPYSVVEPIRGDAGAPGGFDEPLGADPGDTDAAPDPNNERTRAFPLGVRG